MNTCLVLINILFYIAFSVRFDTIQTLIVNAYFVEAIATQFGFV